MRGTSLVGAEAGPRRRRRNRISTCLHRNKLTSCDERPLLSKQKAHTLGSCAQTLLLNPTASRSSPRPTRSLPLTPYAGIFCEQVLAPQYFTGSLADQLDLTRIKSGI